MTTIQTFPAIISLLYSKVSLFNIDLVLNFIWKNYIVCIPLSFSSFAPDHVFKIYPCWFTAAEHSIVWLQHNLFFQPTIDGNLSWFQFWATSSNALRSYNAFCMSILMYVYMVSLTMCPQVVSLGHSICVSSNSTR